MTVCRRGLCELVDQVLVHLMAGLPARVRAVTRKGRRKNFQANRWF